jgi:hypothetical protein
MKLRADVVQITTNFEWVFRHSEFSFEIPVEFSFPTMRNGS